MLFVFKSHEVTQPLFFLFFMRKINNMFRYIICVDFPPFSSYPASLVKIMTHLETT